MKKGYKLSFDVISKHRTILMGITILSIIFFHYTEDCVNYKYNLAPIIVYYKKYIGSSGVDIFLFLSGLGLYYSFKKNQNLGTFFKKRFTRILIPYFIVSIPAWYIKDFLIEDKGLVHFLKDLFFISFFESGRIWFWYILMILVCYLIFPYIFDFINRPGSFSKVINVFIFITVIGIVLDLYNHTLFSNINIALLRFPMFFVGGIVGKLSWNNIVIPKHSWTVWIFSLALLSIKDSSKILLSRYILGVFGIAIILGIAVLLEYLGNKIFCRVYNCVYECLCWFGKYSLELYLTHVAIRGFMNWYGFPTYRIRYECVLVILSIASSFLLKRITNLILENIVYVNRV